MSDRTYNERTESSTLGGHIEASSDAINGWTNRETWAVALHVNNDQGWQESVFEALKGAKEHWENSPAERAYPAFEAGEVIRENVESTLDGMLEGVSVNTEDYEIVGLETYTSVRNDIGSLWRVDWTSLGASFLSDLAEQEQDA